MERQWRLTKAVEQDHDILCPWVFHRQGKPVKDFRNVWQLATREAGCPERIPHDFRRTAVRNLVRAGVPENVAMMLTGHKTRSVFDRYDIVDENDLRDAVQRLASASQRPKRSPQIRQFERSAGTK